MRLPSLTRTWCASLLFVSSCALPLVAQAELKAGAAKIDITPSNLTELNPMGGSFTGVHDPIYSRALVLNDGTQTVAFVATDAIEVGDMNPLRRRIESATGIAFDHILITASHSHSAPRLGNVSAGALAHDGGAESKAYTEAVYLKIIQAIKTAQKQMVPAQLGLAKGTVDVNVNRDIQTEKGWVMGHNPAGPSDKTVWALQLTSLTNAPIAILSNYAVHSYTTLGIQEISGDIAGATAQYVEQNWGGVALWTLGAVGDQAPKIFKGGQKGSNPADKAFAYQAMQAQGVMIGAEIVRLAQTIKPSPTELSINAAEEIFACPVKKATDVMADMKQSNVSSVDTQLMLIKIGDIAIAGVSGEVVTPIYERLKKETLLKDTILVSIANNRIGYIPDDAAFAKNTFEVKGSPVAQGCAENKIINGLKQMMN